MQRRYIQHPINPSTAHTVIAALFVMTLGTACSTLTGTGNDNTCNSPFDCKEGWACIDEKCVKSCIVNEDCSAADDACLGGVCVAGARYACDIDRDCVSPDPCTVIEGATCGNSKCSYIRSPDGNSCRSAPCEFGGLCAGSCQNGACVQCIDDGGCDTGFQCVLNRCEIRPGLGTWCTGIGQGTCGNKLKCESWTCCDAEGSDCCQADSECAGGFACNIAVHSCFAACDPLTAEGCADPATMHCDGTTCSPRLANGAVCMLSEQCVSSQCVDGICCESACDGVCEGCNEVATGQANGTCAALQAGNEDLHPTKSCDATGTGCGAASCACRGLDTRECAAVVGQSCVTAADCASNTCECADASCTRSTCVAVPCGECEYMSSQGCTSGLGEVSPTPDGKLCDGLFACHAGVCLGEVGATCGAPADCNSKLCECADPVCGVRQCSGVECAVCKYTTGAICDGDITPNFTATFACSEGDIYWYDSCNIRAALKESCGAQGCLGGACVTDPIVVGALYPGHANWNSYVNDDGLDAFHATDATCDAVGADGRKAPCIHAGEKLVASGIGFDSCAGLALRDSLGAFDWICDDTGSGALVFYSRGLKENARLADLVSATGWNENFVELLSNSTTVIHSSLSQQWWNNPVLALPTASSTLDAAGTVFVAETTYSTVTSYSINAPGISVVITPAGKLVGTASTSPLLEVFDRDFVWIEGRIENSAPSQDCINLFSSAYSTVRWATMTGCGTGLRVGVGSEQIDVRHVHVSDSENSGLRIASATGVRLSHIRVNNSGGFGIQVIDSDYVTGTNVTTTSNTGSGIHIIGSDAGIWTFITSANNQLGVSMTNSNDQTLVQIAAVNNVQHALQFTGVNGITGSQWALADTWVNPPGEVPQIEMVDVNNGTFSGALLIGPGTTRCSLTGGGDPGLTQDSCLASGSSTHTVVPLTGTLPLQGSFIGRTATTDATNGSNTNGKGTRATITDWTEFENMYRSWGVDAAYGVTGSHGRCLNPGCAIWDWSLDANSMQIRGTSGDGTTQNPTITSGAACPDAVHGSRALPVSGSAPARNFLINAYEVTVEDEPGGDGDGLCESFETCVYAPNFGAYQGTGQLVDSGCIFADGPVASGVQGVRILFYANNGE